MTEYGWNLRDVSSTIKYFFNIVSKDPHALLDQSRAVSRSCQGTSVEFMQSAYSLHHRMMDVMSKCSDVNFEQ